MTLCCCTKLLLSGRARCTSWTSGCMSTASRSITPVYLMLPDNLYDSVNQLIGHAVVAAGTIHLLDHDSLPLSHLCYRQRSIQLVNHSHQRNTVAIETLHPIPQASLLS